MEANPRGATLYLTNLSKPSLDLVANDLVSSDVGNSLGNNFVCSLPQGCQGSLP